MMLSETHVTKEFNDSELKIDGYQLIRCDSNSRHTGGTAIYIKDEFKFKILHNEQKSKTWILSINVSDSLIDGCFSVIYKSPKEKINDFLAIIDEFCENKIEEGNKNIIVGDMNIDVSRNSKNVKRYLKEIETHNVKQIVIDYTRIDVKNNTKTIIDHIYINKQ